MSQSLLTVKDLSSCLGLHPNSIYKLVEKGEIPFIKRKGLGIRFKKEEIEKWLSESSNYTSQTEFLPKSKQLDISIKEYDKLYLEGDSAVAKKRQRWNYGRKGVFLRKLKSGLSWCIWYYDENGKIKKMTVQGATCREDAIAAMESKLRNVFSKRYGIKQKTIKFKNFAAIYLEKYAKPKKRSWKTDEKFLKSQLIPFFSEIELSEITPEHVSDFVAKRKNEGVKGSTINKHLQVLGKMMNLADDYGYKVEKNPVRSFHFSNEAENRRKRVLSHDEEELLMKKAAPHLKPIIQIALETGMRLQEILRLRVEDVDFSQDIITIRPDNNKTGKMDLIPLPSSMKDLLRKLIRENGGRTEFVFNYLDPRNGEFRPISSIRHAFQGTCRRADIKNLQFRDLRRTYGTRLHQKGVDPLIIQRLLRHSSFKISEQVYIQSSMKMMKEVLKKVEEKQARKDENITDLEHLWNMKDKVREETPISPFFSVN